MHKAGKKIEICERCCEGATHKEPGAHGAESTFMGGRTKECRPLGGRGLLVPMDFVKSKATDQIQESHARGPILVEIVPQFRASPSQTHVPGNLPIWLGWGRVEASAVGARVDEKCFSWKSECGDRERFHDSIVPTMLRIRAERAPFEHHTIWFRGLHPSTNASASLKSRSAP